MAVSTGALLGVLIAVFVGILLIIMCIGYFSMPIWPILFNSRKRKLIRHCAQRILLLEMNEQQAAEADLEEQRMDPMKKNTDTLGRSHDMSSKIVLDSFPIESIKESSCGTDKAVLFKGPHGIGDANGRLHAAQATVLPSQAHCSLNATISDDSVYKSAVDESLESFESKSQSPQQGFSLRSKSLAISELLKVQAERAPLPLAAAAAAAAQAAANDADALVAEPTIVGKPVRTRDVSNEENYPVRSLYSQSASIVATESETIIREVEDPYSDFMIGVGQTVVVVKPFHGSHAFEFNSLQQGDLIRVNSFYILEEEDNFIQERSIRLKRKLNDRRVSSRNSNSHADDLEEKSFLAQLEPEGSSDGIVGREISISITKDDPLYASVYCTGRLLNQFLDTTPPSSDIVWKKKKMEENGTSEVDAVKDFPLSAVSLESTLQQ